MGLTQEEIDALLTKKSRGRGPAKPTTGDVVEFRPRRLTRISTHFPVLPKDGPVTYHERTKSCESQGCGAPSHLDLKGVPYCDNHIIIALVHLLQQATGNYKGESVEASDNLTIGDFFSGTDIGISAPH
jgi:hypothetical protein